MIFDTVMSIMSIVVSEQEKCHFHSWLDIIACVRIPLGQNVYWVVVLVIVRNCNFVSKESELNFTVSSSSGSK